MPSSPRSVARFAAPSTALLVLLLAAVVYARTAYPTIAWWDSSQYSLAAATLGVTGPPGSLLLTLLGWPVATLTASRIPSGASPAHALNLLAGVIAATTCAVVFLAAHNMWKGRDREGDQLAAPSIRWSVPLAGAALGALAFAAAPTLWVYAVQFTPYGLTACCTALLWWTLVHWWQHADTPRGLRFLALLGVLFGLDVSVHRTNALLIPAAALWILLRSPRTLRAPRVWAVGTVAFLAGLAVHLLLIPIARTTASPLGWNDPADLARLWRYVSLERMGGGFLLDLFPRKAPFWQVQVGDLLRAVRDNFLHTRGPAGVLGVMPGLCAVYGVVSMCRRAPRLAAAFLAVLFVQAALTVLYFNIPSDYFRSLDRHYLPVLVTIGIAMVYGAADVAATLTRRVAGRRTVVGAALMVCALCLPGAALFDGWRAHDASARHFTGDYARNALQALPPHAIYVTVGDNDTFPVLYMQAVEGVRPDVTLVNYSLAFMPEYLALLLRREPSFPLSLPPAQRASVSPDLGERVLRDIVHTNAGRRPLAISTTGVGIADWLMPRARLDGLYWRMMPGTQPVIDTGVLRTNLMGGEYRGYADRRVVIDDVSRTMAVLLYDAFDTLLAAETAQGAVGSCEADRAWLLRSVPPARLAAGAPASGASPAELDAIVARIRSRCGTLVPTRPVPAPLRH